MYEELAIRVEMFGDDIERLYYLHPLTGEVMREVDECSSSRRRTTRPVRSAWRGRYGDRARVGRSAGRVGEAQQAPRGAAAADAHDVRHRDDAAGRLLLGIENYSRHIDGRAPGSPPNCLLDYFPDDFLLVMDESHDTVPQTAACMRATCPASERWSSTDSGCPRQWTTGPSSSRSSSIASGRPSTSPPRRVRTSWAGRGASSSSRSSGRPVSSTRRSIVKPTKGQIDDLVSEIRNGPSATSGSSSPR